MAERLTVTKTYKLYINGAFPRSESGRSLIVSDRQGRVLAHVSRASRKDLRDAVEAAAAAQAGWSAAAAYNRGQVLYRMAEMLEGKRDEFIAALGAAASEEETSDTSETSKRPNIQTAKDRGKGKGSKASAKELRSRTRKPVGRPMSPKLAAEEIDASIDRLISFAGWADKYAQVLGCHNSVAAPYYNFTVPEPTGVTAVVAPDEPALLGLISLFAPPLCAGNAIVALAGDRNPLPAAILAEVCATSDLPAGALNILTGRRGELLEHLAKHREVNAIAAANLKRSEMETLRLGIADNLKRVSVKSVDDWLDAAARENPWTIEPFVEMKTIWHPSAT